MHIPMYQEQSPEEEKLYETCLKGSRDDIRNYCKRGDLSTHYLRDGLNPMHVVAIAGRKDAELILEMMLQNGFDVNSQTRSGDDTVLHLLIEHLDVKEAFPLVLKVLEYRPDLTIRNRKLRTAYDIALAKAEFELAEVLDGTMNAEQARQFYIEKIGTLYGGKLVDAVVGSREQDIEEFINLGANPNFVNEHKNGAIHYAITHCKLSTHRILSLLIQAGADVNLQDDEGDTALNLVIKSARLRDSGEMLRCVELLVQHGALSTFKDLDGYDALSLAKRRNYADIVAMLQNNRPRDVQHRQLVRRQESQNLELRGQIRADDVTARDNVLTRRSLTQDDTPRQGPSYRTPPPAPDTNRTRPTPRSPPPPFPDLTNYVNDDDFSHPAPGQIVSAEISQIALIRATRQGTVDDVNNALHVLRAEPNIPDDDGIYPIHHVLIRGEFENEDERVAMLKALYEAGADINMQTVNSESTALHIAATNNQFNEAKWLLDTHKCDYNIKNREGLTPYEVAEQEECPEVMEVIDNHRKAIQDRMKKAAKASTCTIL